VIHLDTSFMIRALVRGTREDATLRGWLNQGEQLAICTIAWTEFLCGPVTAEQVDMAMLVVTNRLPFDEPQARIAADLFNLTGRRRGSLVDCMIAAVAIDAGAPIATSNFDDFERYTAKGLVLAGGQ